MNYFIKQSPITGLAGFGGGASGLGVAGGGVAPALAVGDRGFSGGGRIPAGGSSGATNQMDYWDITTTSNAADFGNLTQRGEGAGPASNKVRGCFAGRWSYADSSSYNIIDYFTLASTGNASDFGDCIRVCDNVSGTADINVDRGIFGAIGSTTYNNELTYITISTTGDAQDFGDLIAGKYGRSATCNGVYAWWAGGSTFSVNIDWHVTATLGDATDFGDLTRAKEPFRGGTCSETRNLVFGGYASSWYGAEIDYWGTVSTGNASDFGDLTEGRSGIASTGNGTRGTSTGGYPSGGPVTDKMDYITIDTTGDATDAGDLDQIRGWHSALSGNAS